MDAAEYRKLKVPELKEILTERGVAIKGLKKEELVLKCVESQPQSDDDAGGDDDGGKTEQIGEQPGDLPDKKPEASQLQTTEVKPTSLIKTEGNNETIDKERQIKLLESLDHSLIKVEAVTEHKVPPQSSELTAASPEKVASDPGENIKTEVEQTSQESTNVNTHSDQGVSSDTDKLHNSDNTANTDIAASLQNAAGLPENTEMETSVENSDSQLEPATTEKEKDAGDSNSPQELQSLPQAAIEEQMDTNETSTSTSESQDTLPPHTERKGPQTPPPEAFRGPRTPPHEPTGPRTPPHETTGPRTPPHEPPTEDEEKQPKAPELTAFPMGGIFSMLSDTPVAVTLEPQLSKVISSSTTARSQSTAATGQKRKLPDAFAAKPAKPSNAGLYMVKDKPKKEWKYDPEPVVMEQTHWLERKEFQLDRYNCHLNSVISDDGNSYSPLSRKGFGYMWGGVKATYGVSSPCNVAYQIRITGDCHINITDQPFGSNYMLRVGWSTDDNRHQLGETPFSYGYQSDGKRCTNGTFDSYGESYTIGDVITAYMDITESMIRMYFAKNSGSMALAYEFQVAQLGLNSLFPHVSSKNLTVEFNFGQVKKPWAALESGYMFLGHLPNDCRERAPAPPRTKADCQVLLMVGMIGAGKSTWVAKKLNAEHGKHWNVIGTPEILDQMKVDGQDLQQCFKGRWDDLFDKTNTCLKKLIPIAAAKMRNYILDQTNVYEGAQSRKVRPFQGFKRKAVVVLPSDEMYQQRLAERQKTLKKSVHPDAILEMKANYFLPLTVPLQGKEKAFDDVIFTDLKRPQAETLVEQYHAEGLKKFKKVAKQYHKKDLKAKQRVEDLARRAEKVAMRARGGLRGGGRGGGRGRGGRGGHRFSRGGRGGGGGHRNQSINMDAFSQRQNNNRGNFGGPPNSWNNMRQPFGGNRQQNNQQQPQNFMSNMPNNNNMGGSRQGPPSNQMPHGGPPANQMAHGNQPANQMAPGGPAVGQMMERMISQLPPNMSQQMSQMWGQMQNAMAQTMTAAMQQTMMQTFQQQLTNMQQQQGGAGGASASGGASNTNSWNQSQQGWGQQQQQGGWDQQNQQQQQTGGWGIQNSSQQQQQGQGQESTQQYDWSQAMAAYANQNSGGYGQYNSNYNQQGYGGGNQGYN